MLALFPLGVFGGFEQVTAGIVNATPWPLLLASIAVILILADWLLVLRVEPQA